MSDAKIEEQRAAQRARMAFDDIVTNAMCTRYRELTGKKASEKLWDEIWQAVHYNS